MDKQRTHLKTVFGSKKKRLEVDVAQLTQEMYKRNLELADINRTLSLLRTIDNLTLESHDELEVLCQNIAQAIIEKSSFPLVAIMANPPHKDFLELMGWASSFEGLPEVDRYRVELDDHDKWIVSPERTAIIDVTQLSDNFIAHLLHDSVDDVAALRQVIPLKSIAIMKLLSRHRLVGLMAVGFTEPINEITEKEKALLDRLAEVVGIALDNKLLFEENQQVLRQLQKTNEKLKTMDETKDEFISMASHQLRTPLTSVKGYLSMVLEGDAGEISEMQRKLLSQAFASSQRMVYLIADLLNVSRLRTGKFVIEAVATNLADVVESEVNQLQETAQARGLKLSYEKPAKFPSVMLDETKIRQVIMNFMDNAIYYTPTGGHIVVGIRETDKTIEYTVTDDGLGVPKAEQHHLFTKFYRAGNARKARPDGTGLGLFMAKKVIVAQGGSIIFKSQEGAGSTFGFSFDKSKLQPPTSAPTN
ncbi:MAG TPA: HAMP domain-containing sensor histidine kinase [Patescibacteria group bacterium]|nr:HAMP domain-containing sensor histidine kinase [Candidatus Saccharimonadales bacterium]HSX46502.1 HAMP domain-containing sensor histidine kinase [Patescibacteria group bacterium]